MSYSGSTAILLKDPSRWLSEVPALLFYLSSRVSPKVLYWARYYWRALLICFADDMAIYRPIRSTRDYFAFQSDISAISIWINNAHFSLQPTKCSATLISRKWPSSDALPPLYVEGVPLPYLSSVKDLSIIITYNLSWSEHVSTINSKVRQLTGDLFQNFPIQHPNQALCNH